MFVRLVSTSHLFSDFDELCRELCQNPLKGRSEIDKARAKAYDQEGLKRVSSPRHSVLVAFFVTVFGTPLICQRIERGAPLRKRPLTKI